MYLFSALAVGEARTGVCISQEFVWVVRAVSE